MPIAFKFEGETCPHCGSEALYWYSTDETETTVEVYMNCDPDDGCGHEFRKLRVNKSEDTSDSALKERLREQYL